MFYTDIDWAGAHHDSVVIDQDGQHKPLQVLATGASNSIKIKRKSLDQDIHW